MILVTHNGEAVFGILTIQHTISIQICVGYIASTHTEFHLCAIIGTEDFTVHGAIGITIDISHGATAHSRIKLDLSI